MKLYRIIPDTFNLMLYNDYNHYSVYILDKLNFYNFEELYYELGFTSFFQNPFIFERIHKKDYSSANSFDVIDRGKFFFIYPEYAILVANQITKFKGLVCCNYILIEYDFPIELVSEYIGIGTYSINNNYTSNLFEFFIPDSKFGTYELANILEEEKYNIFFKYFQKSIEHLNCSLKALPKICVEADLLSEMLKKYNKLLSSSNYAQVVEDSLLFKSFIKNRNYLIQSQYITGRSCFIDGSDIYRLKYDNRFSVEDIFLKYGIENKGIIRPDTLFDDEMINSIKYGKNKEKIMTLLKQRENLE